MKLNLNTFLTTAFSGFLIYLFDKVFGNIIPWDSIREINFLGWLTYCFCIEFKIYQIILFIFFITILSWGLKKIKNIRSRNNDSIYSVEQNRFIKENYKTFDEKEGLLCEFTVGFKNGNTPFIYNFEIFCTLHEVPHRFIANTKCDYPKCKNNVRFLINSPEYKIKNLIESDLINKWRKLKNHDKNE